MITTILSLLTGGWPAILSALKNYWKPILIILLVTGTSIWAYNKIYDRGYAAADKLRQDLITQLQTENNKLKSKHDTVATQVQVVYKDRVQYIEKKSQAVKDEVHNGALKDEKVNCVIGPNFIRLHNQSADPVQTN